MSSPEPPSTEQAEAENALRETILFSAYLLLRPPRGENERDSADSRDGRDTGDRRAASFVPKERVMLVGLRTHPRLNGCHACIQEKSEVRTRRWIVELEDTDLLLSFVSVHENNMVAARQQPSDGRCLLLHSLKFRKDLNGQSVFVHKSDTANRSRVIVRTASNAYLSVPVACTLLLPVSSKNSIQSKITLQKDCCICLQVISALTAADPCGHTSVCENCSQQFSVNAPCPICREPVAKYIRIYN